MKTLLILLVLAAGCFAAEPRPSDYMNGKTTRDVGAALARAKSENKPVVIVTFDAKSKKMTNPYTLEGFFKMPETKKLLAENFIQVFAPWSAAGIQQYLDPTDKTELPEAIFLDPSGKMIDRVRFQYGPAQALEQVQAVVAKATKATAK